MPKRDCDCDPEREVLLLPSAYPPQIRAHPSFQVAVSVERTVRRAEASDALQQVRHKQGLHAFLWKKTSGTFGQVAKTRNQKTFRDVKDKLEAARCDYERARLKLYDIAGEGDIANYPPLSTDDCKKMTLYHDQEEPGMQNKTVSWIWRHGQSYGEDIDVYSLEGASFLCLTCGVLNEHQSSYHSSTNRVVPCKCAPAAMAGRGAHTRSRDATDTALL